MKKSSVSRRKFLTGFGVATGAAMVMPTMNSIGVGTKSKGSLLDAWTKQSNSYFLTPVQILSRKPGSYLLPLAKRPL